MIRLTPRLKTVASLVREGARLADVGTDHGYIPVYLMLKGKIKSAVAGDIGEMPLKSAEKTINSYGLSGSIKTVLSDGLVGFLPYETDDIVIAGMGGELIVDILSRAEWVKNENIHLVLQPMTHSEDVRRYLTKNGFYTEKEIAVGERNKIYIIISAYYNGKENTVDEFYNYFGKLDNSVLSKKYRDRQYDRLMKKYNGALCSGDNEASEKCKKLMNRYPDEYIEDIFQ